MSTPLSSRCTSAEAVQALADPSTDAWLRTRVVDEPGPTATARSGPAGIAAGAGAGGTPSLTGRWLLAALDRLEMCVDLHHPVGILPSLS